jgi:class 3 adenylate cyclase
MRGSGALHVHAEFEDQSAGDAFLAGTAALAAATQLAFFVQLAAAGDLVDDARQVELPVAIRVRARKDEVAAAGGCSTVTWGAG